MLGLVVWSALLLHHQLWFAANKTSVRPSRNPPQAASTPALSASVERVDDEKQVERKVVVMEERVEAKGVYKLFRTAVDLLEEDPTDVPPLVRALNPLHSLPPLLSFFLFLFRSR